MFDNYSKPSFINLNKSLIPKKTIILGFLLISNFALCQNTLENLENQYNNSKSNSEKLIATTAYVTSLFSNKKIDLAQKILHENIQIAIKNNDYSTASILYCVEAMNLRIRDKILDSEKKLALAKKASLKSNSNETKGYVAYCEGWLNSRNGEQSKAVANILSALKHYDNSPNSSTLLKRKSSAYNELSVIYANLGEEVLHEKYTKIALELALKQDDPQVLFSASMKMGNLYERLLSKNQNSINYRNLAEKYFLQAVEIFNKNKGTMSSTSDLSFAANNLASLYFYSFPETYREKALSYAKMANEIALNNGQADHIASTYGILSEIELAQENPDQAVLYLFKAFDAIKKSTNIDRNIELNIYESLVSIFESQGKYKEAVKYQRDYMNLFKTLYDQEKLEITKRLEAQFDKERQKQEYIKLQLETDKKAQQIDLMSALGIQQEQALSNLKLKEENQREKLKFTELESQKSAQQLRLSRLETQQKNNDILIFKRILAYKEKINTYYVISIAFFAALIALLLYAYKQRIKAMKNRDELHNLALEKEKQNSKISTLTALLDGQEKERSRLAKDLHDGLGGLLSGTKLQLTHLNNKIDDFNKEGIENSINQIDGAVEELRRVAHNLMPDLLDKYGLEVALQEFATRMSNEFLDIHVQFLSFTNTLEQERELLVYRIIQELVNNAIKHANSSQIIIQLVEETDHILVTVEDDGKGFNSEKINLRQSAGFHNIQSRVEFLKGTISIQSEENVGTSVEFQFPKKQS